MESQQEAEYTQKIDRLLKRWAHEKVETVHSKQQRDRVEFNKATEKEVKIEVDNKEQHFLLETRKTEIAAKCQVLVVGGGPAGLSAAIASARAGADTLIIEKFGCFGGVITTVGMETLGWYRYEGTSDSEGIGREMQKIAEKMGGSTKWPYNDSQCLDAEQFKIIADNLILENKIRPLLHTYVVDSIVEDNVVKGVIVESKSGRQAILAERVIDCSGDADVAHFSGCRYTKLPLAKSLGVTSVFNVSGIDSERFKEYATKDPQTYLDWDTGTWSQETTGKEKHLHSPYFGREFKAADSRGLIPQQDKDLNLDYGGSWSAISEAGEATNLNLVHMKGFDVLSNEDLTKAEMLGRRGSVTALNALKALVPGFEKGKLRNFGMTLGVRDSRKIVGEYNLTGDDVCKQARFDDSVGVFPEFVDGYSILILPTTGRFFEIPYRCLIPDMDNLLVAGRCVSGDMVSHAATRNMMCCTVTGQAAGVAAAVSIKTQKSTKSVDYKRIQEELQRQGARIH